MSENDDGNVYQSPLVLKILGAAFLAGAMFICLYSFNQISRNVESSLILTGYFASLPVGTEISFGYGGESSDAKVDVPLQGKEMSNLAFKISHQSEGVLTVTPIDDRLRHQQKWHEKGVSFRIVDGDEFRTQGILGGAAFRVNFNLEKNELRLILLNPIYRELDLNRRTRLVFGLNFVPLPVAEDEIFFRSSLNQGKNNNLIIIPSENEIQLQTEPDLAVHTPGQIPTTNKSTEQIVIKSEESKDFGNLTLKYSRHSPSAVFLYGVKLCLGMLFLGLAFLVGPQIKTPNGFLIFGTTAFLLSLGIILSARDFFFVPHQGRLSKYVDVMFWCIVLLFGLRYPHGVEDVDDQTETNANTGTLVRLVLSGVLILLAYCSFYRNFNPVNDSLPGNFFPGVITLSLVLCGYIAVLIITSLFYRFVRLFLERLSSSSADNKTKGIILIISVLPLIFCLATWILGYQIMLWVPVVGRIYLPILMLPLLVAGAILSVYTTELKQSNETLYFKWICLIILWGTVVLYRLYSGDNGGTLLVSIGLLTAYGLTMRSRLAPIILAIILAVGGVVALSASERFELAWRPDEAQVNYYDQAKNLRVARDMARSGSWSGQWFSLRIPSDIRNNIHNDLASAYVAGFFGWVILAFVLLAYLLFYLALWGSLSVFSQADAENVSISDSDNTLPLLASFSAALLLPFFVQSLWVFIQPLQPSFPLIGLDLPPISNSGSSVLSFLIIVIGSNIVCQTLKEALRE